MTELDSYLRTRPTYLLQRTWSIPKTLSNSITLSTHRISKSITPLSSNAHRPNISIIATFRESRAFAPTASNKTVSSWALSSNPVFTILAAANLIHLRSERTLIDFSRKFQVLKKLIFNWVCSSMKRLNLLKSKSFSIMPGWPNWRKSWWKSMMGFKNRKTKLSKANKKWLATNLKPSNSRKNCLKQLKNSTKQKRKLKCTKPSLELTSIIQN